MPTKFQDFVKEVEREAKLEGPQAEGELRAFRAYYAMAQNIRQLRLRQGLTQKELAAASGINQGDISRIERGQANPTAMTLAALLAPLNAHFEILPNP